MEFLVSPGAVLGGSIVLVLVIVAGTFLLIGDLKRRKARQGGELDRVDSVAIVLGIVSLVASLVPIATSAWKDVTPVEKPLSSDVIAESFTATADGRCFFQSGVLSFEGDDRTAGEIQQCQHFGSGARLAYRFRAPAAIGASMQIVGVGGLFGIDTEGEVHHPRATATWVVTYDGAQICEAHARWKEPASCDFRSPVPLVAQAEIEVVQTLFDFNPQLPAFAGVKDFSILVRT